MSEAIRYSRGAEKHDNTPAQCEAEDFAQFCDAILSDRAITKGMNVSLQVASFLTLTATTPNATDAESQPSQSAGTVATPIPR